MSQTIIIKCDFCGKIKPEQISGSAQPFPLWSTLTTIVDYRPCGANSRIDKTEYDICVNCTDKILLKAKRT